MSGFTSFKFKPKDKPTSSSSSSSTAQVRSVVNPERSSFTQKKYGNTFSNKYSTEEEYFENDEDKNAENKKEYQPLSDSSDEEKPDLDEDDPLDAFMMGVEKTAKEDLKNIGKKEAKKETKGKRDDIEDEDDHESYFRWLEENPNAGASAAAGNDDDQDIDYDDDGNLIIPEKKKTIDPLPPIDHSKIEYEKFEKNFYKEHEDIEQMTKERIEELRNKLNIKVFGLSPPKPVCSFAHFNFDQSLMNAIRKSEFTQPTPIQSQAIPAALSGRDIIGIAKTGSGKTDAYIWPSLVHTLHQRELKPGEGPIVLILAPTRELVQQIHSEVKKFAKAFNISSACAFGGGSLYEQTLACENGVEILVSTPGRLIDLIKKKGTNLQRVTYLVLDEADRMFDMGFEPQVRSIANHCRPDRQTLLFSATFKKKIEKLARETLIDPIKIIQGEIGEACEDVTQITKLFAEGPDKWNWLLANLVQFTSAGKVLIFVTQKTNSAELNKNLQENGFKTALLHGDMHQDDRNLTINNFKKTDLPILVATDVAARGLDIHSIKTVINYDVARDIDTHIHRIGRTGRAGEKGTAYTLISPKEKEFLPHLIKNLETTNQDIPDEIMKLALEVPWFKSQRSKNNSKSSGGNKFYRERPGLGSGGESMKKSDKSEHYRHESHDSGPQTDRVSVLKQAYKNQFKSSFVSSSTPSSSNLMSTKSESSAKRESTENKDDKPKKSRWN